MATGPGVGAGDGVAVGGATAGVGLAVGETFGAPAGAWAMHEVANTATRRNSLRADEEAIAIIINA